MSVEAYFIMGVFFHCLWLCVSIVLLIVHPPIHTLMHAPEMTIRLPFNRQSRTHRALRTWGDLRIVFIFLIFVPFPWTWHLLAQLCLPAATLAFLPPLSGWALIPQLSLHNLPSLQFSGFIWQKYWLTQILYLEELLETTEDSPGSFPVHMSCIVPTFNSSVE